MTHPSPTVAIILPAFNAEQTLERAVQSCLEQSFKDFTLLIINDGSTDQTAQVAQRLAESDSRIAIINHPTNQGVVQAMQTGLAHVDPKTLYIARMDADDWNHPQRLEKQVALLESNPELGTASCQIKIVGSEFDLTGKPREGFAHYAERQNSILSPDDHLERRFEEAPLCNPTALTRRSVFEALGGVQNPRWAEDYDFWLRHLHQSLSNTGFAIAKVPEVLFHWHDSPDRLTRQDTRYSEALFLEAKAHFLAQLPAIQHQGVALSGTGMIAKIIGQHLLERGIRIRDVYDVSRKKTGQDFLGLSIQHASELPAYSKSSPIQLSTIGRKERRKKAEDFLRQLGYQRGKGYYLVA